MGHGGHGKLAIAATLGHVDQTWQTARCGLSCMSKKSASFRVTREASSRVGRGGISVELAFDRVLLIWPPSHRRRRPPPPRRRRLRLQRHLLLVGFVLLVLLLGRSLIAASASMLPFCKDSAIEVWYFRDTRPISCAWSRLTRGSRQL